MIPDVPYPNTLDQISSWLHIVAACVFIGGLAAWLVIVGPALAAVGDPQARSGAEEKGRRSLRIFVALGLVVLLITGAYQLVRYVGTQEGVLQTPRGLALMLKIMVALLAFLLFLFAPYPHGVSRGRRVASRLFYAGAALVAAGVILLSRYIR